MPGPGYSTGLNRWVKRSSITLKALASEAATAQGGWLDVGDVNAAEIDVVVTVAGTSLLVDIYGSGSGTNRSVADGVTNTDTSLVSATAAFTTADVGSQVWGAGIPANTHILSRTNATTVVLSAATTATATGVTVNISESFKIATLGANGFVMGLASDPTAISAIGTYRNGFGIGARYLQYRSRMTSGPFTYSITLDAS